MDNQFNIGMTPARGLCRMFRILRLCVASPGKLPAGAVRAQDGDRLLGRIDAARDRYVLGIGQLRTELGQCPSKNKKFSQLFIRSRILRRIDSASACSVYTATPPLLPGGS